MGKDNASARSNYNHHNLKLRNPHKSFRKTPLWVFGFGVAILVLGSSRRGVARVPNWHPEALPCDHLPHTGNYILLVVWLRSCFCGCGCVVVCCGCVFVVVCCDCVLRLRVAVACLYLCFCVCGCVCESVFVNLCLWLCVRGCVCRCVFVAVVVVVCLSLCLWLRLWLCVCDYVFVFAFAVVCLWLCGSVCVCCSWFACLCLWVCGYLCLWVCGCVCGCVFVNVCARCPWNQRERIVFFSAGGSRSLHETRDNEDADAVLPQRTCS